MPEAATAPARRGNDEFLLGAWQMLPLLIAVIPFALIMGALCAEKGMSPLETALMSALVFAGSSQFVAAGLWQHPIPMLAIVAGTALINSRHLLMGAALAPNMGAFGRPRAYLSLFFMADENWAMAMRRAAAGPLTASYYLGLSVPFYLSWVLWTTVGNLIGGVIADPKRFGFDFAFAAVFLVILLSLNKARRNLLPIAVSAVAALVAWRLLPGSAYIFAGGLAGTVAGALAGQRPAHAP
jgi:4-azaleucine resistance transporter AzlC